MWNHQPNFYIPMLSKSPLPTSQQYLLYFLSEQPNSCITFHVKCHFNSFFFNKYFKTTFCIAYLKREQRTRPLIMFYFFSFALAVWGGGKGGRGGVVTIMFSIKEEENYRQYSHHINFDLKSVMWFVKMLSRINLRHFEGNSFSENRTPNTKGCNTHT